MIEESQIRAALLLLPLLTTLALFLWRKPTPKIATAALFSFLWQLPALLLVNIIANQYHWWAFPASSHQFMGMPVDVWIGWALWWGPVLMLAFPKFKLIALVAIAVWLDVWLMPLLEPLLYLGSDWLWGEVLALTIVLLPAQLLARWTIEDKCLAGRVVLLFLCFVGLAVWVLPTIILIQTNGDWSHVLVAEFWQRSLMLTLLIMPAIMGLSAVYEFYLRGKGTPIPYDPPKHLVTTGPYAYIGNPMQLAAALIWLLLGIWLQSIWVAVAAIMAVIFGLGLADWEERSALSKRFGPEWAAYRMKVRNWLPHWYPLGMPSARIYIAEACGPCEQLAFWLKCQKPLNLIIIPAQQHPERDLRWVTYVVEGEVYEEEGIKAIARMLEHIHLGWAWFGWLLRLPVISFLAQLLLEISFEKPMVTCRRSSVETSSSKNIGNSNN